MCVKYEIVSADREWSSRLKVKRGFIFPWRKTLSFFYEIAHTTLK